MQTENAPAADDVMNPRRLMNKSCQIVLLLLKFNQNIVDHLRRRYNPEPTRWCFLFTAEKSPCFERDCPPMSPSLFRIVTAGILGQVARHSADWQSSPLGSDVGIAGVCGHCVVGAMFEKAAT